MSVSDSESRGWVGKRQPQRQSASAKPVPQLGANKNLNVGRSVGRLLVVVVVVEEDEGGVDSGII